MIYSLSKKQLLHPEILTKKEIQVLKQEIEKSNIQKFKKFYRLGSGKFHQLMKILK